MSLQAWLAKAAAMGKKGMTGMNDLVHGTEELRLGRAAGYEMPRIGGLLGEGGMKDQAAQGLGAVRQGMGPTADALEAFLRDHPNLKAAGSGLLGAGAGAMLAGGGHDDGDEDDDPRHRRGMR